MDNKIGVISEVIVLIVNVLIFMRMTVLKKDTLATRMIMYIGSAIILGVFFVCTYTGLLPEALGSFVCVTIPSFTLFFILSKYKDFRFFVTFCFIDTVTMVLTFFSRMIGLMGGAIATVISGIAVCLVMLLIYFTGAPYFKRYRELMENVEGGWGTTAIATLLIYGLLIFTASYPKPLVERQEYLLPYAFLSVTILSFYVVFIRTLLQRKALSDLNAQLMQEMQWHEIAYSDGLTGLGNRMAYMEQVSKVERTAEESACIYVVVIDINNFKRINILKFGTAVVGEPSRIFIIRQDRNILRYKVLEEPRDASRPYALRGIPRCGWKDRRISTRALPRPIRICRQERYFRLRNYQDWYAHRSRSRSPHDDLPKIHVAGRRLMHFCASNSPHTRILSCSRIFPHRDERAHRQVVSDRRPRIRVPHRRFDTRRRICNGFCLSVPRQRTDLPHRNRIV